MRKYIRRTLKGAGVLAILLAMAGILCLGIIWIVDNIIVPNQHELFWVLVWFLFLIYIGWIAYSIGSSWEEYREYREYEKKRKEMMDKLNQINKDYKLKYVDQ